jgi:hypothetical protein
MKAGREATTEATDLEANPEEIKSEEEHEEVPKKEAAVEAIGALKDRYRDRRLAIGHPRQPKKRIQGPSRSWPPSVDG